MKAPAINLDEWQDELRRLKEAENKTPDGWFSVREYAEKEKISNSGAKCRLEEAMRRNILERKRHGKAFVYRPAKRNKK